MNDLLNINDLIDNAENSAPKKQSVNKIDTNIKNDAKFSIAFLRICDKIAITNAKNYKAVIEELANVSKKNKKG